MNRLLPLFLAIVLVIGGEYKITHLSGRTSLCKIKGVTPDGDYIIHHPKKILGYNAGRIPIILWNKQEILLSAFDISEARLLKPPAQPQDNSWNRLTKTWVPPSELSKPLYDQ